MTYETKQLGTHPNSSQISEAFRIHEARFLGRLTAQYGYRDLAEEIMQDSAVRMLSHGLPADGTVSMEQAMGRHTRCATVDRFRSRTAQLERDTAYGKSTARLIGNGTPAPWIRSEIDDVLSGGPAEEFEDTVIGNAWFEAAMARLSPQQRRAMELRFIDDLNQEEVATVMEVSLGTAKSYQKVAIDKLRQLVLEDAL